MKVCPWAVCVCVCEREREREKEREKCACADFLQFCLFDDMQGKTINPEHKVLLLHNKKETKV